MNRRTTATMILVLLGAVLSLGSFGLGYSEQFTESPTPITEFFPFFHWRLYGDPKGAEGASTWRIYSREEDGQAWIRHPIKPRNGWSRYAYGQQLGLRIDAVLRGGDGEDLGVFVRDILGHLPDQVHLVRESYYPMDLLSDSSAYDTTSVVFIDRGAVRVR